MTRLDFRRLTAIALAAVVIRLAVSASFKGHSYLAPDSVKPEPEAAYLKRGEIGLTDSEQYLLLGKSIRHRFSYTWNHEPNTFRTPGYPLLLALVDGSPAATVILQALLAGLTVFLTGLIGYRLFSVWAGLLAAGLLAVDVPSIFLSGMVMSEVLFAFSVVLAAALIWSGKVPGLRATRWRPLLAGLVLGFAVLVRPVALLAFVPFGLVLVTRRTGRGLVAMIAAFFLLPGIWVARNYYHYHRFSLTSNGGYNLLYADAAAVIGEKQHTTWDVARVELARDFTSKLATGNPLVLADSMTRKATSIILHDPLLYGWICVHGLPKVIAGVKADDLVLRILVSRAPATKGSVLVNREYGSTGARLMVWLLAGFELFTSIGAFLLALVSLGLRRRRTEKLLLLFIGLYFVAAALPFTDGRFRVPAMPFLYLAAAAVLAGRAGGANGTVTGKVA